MVNMRGNKKCYIVETSRSANREIDDNLYVISHGEVYVFRLIKSLEKRCALCFYVNIVVCFALQIYRINYVGRDVSTFADPFTRIWPPFACVL